ncbi:hypothetical protein C8R43DRAFT_964102 [Mycena crocata]|nr:hypothetical protein C8R43DRAFT_964102 [Mycena crocata]
MHDVSCMLSLSRSQWSKEEKATPIRQINTAPVWIMDFVCSSQPLDDGEEDLRVHIDGSDTVHSLAKISLLSSATDSDSDPINNTIIAKYPCWSYHFHVGPRPLRPLIRRVPLTEPSCSVPPAATSAVTPRPRGSLLRCSKLVHRVTTPSEAQQLIGRGHREPDVTPARKEYNEKRKRDREAGERRVATRAANGRTRFRPPNPHPLTPQTPRGLPLTSGTLLTPTPAPIPRVPLQPVVNAQTAPTHADFSRFGGQSSENFFPVPYLQPGIEWFNTLRPGSQAALLAAHLDYSSVSTGGSGGDGNFGMGVSFPPLRHLCFNPFTANTDIQGPHSFGDGTGLSGDADDDGDLPGDDDRDYIEDSWTRPEEPSPDDDEDQAPPPAISSLEFTMRSVEPAYQQKANRKKRKAAPLPPTEDDADENPTDDEARPKKQAKSRSIHALASDDHERIYKLSFDKIKSEVTRRWPFPIRGKGTRRPGLPSPGDMIELIRLVFTDAAFDLGLSTSQIFQFRGGLKTLAALLVPAAYGLTDISTIRNLTPGSIAEGIENNRLLRAVCFVRMAEPEKVLLITVESQWFLSF